MNYFKAISISIIIVIVTILVFNIMFGFISAVKNEFNDAIVENKGLKVIEIKGRWDQDRFQSIPLSEDDINKIGGMDNIVCVFPFILKLVAITNSSISKGTYLLGLPDKALPVFSGINTISNYNGIILNSDYENGVTKNEKVKVGYNIIIGENTGTLKESGGVIEGFYKQTDILDVPDGVSIAKLDYVTDLNAQSSGMSLDAYKKELLTYRQLVIVKDISKIPDTAKTLEKQGYVTNFYLSSARGIPGFAKSTMIVGSIILVILILFSIVLIRLTISKLLNSRNTEIGLYKTVGYRDRDIFKILTYEMLFFAIISYLLSTAISILGITIFNRIVSRDSTLLYFFNIKISAVSIVLSFILIVLIIGVSCIRNMRKTAALNPIDILRSE